MAEPLSLLEIFARNLRDAMDRNPGADTTTKVADRSHGGVSQQHVSKLLRREAAPTLETLDVLSKAVGVMPWELLVDNDEVKRHVVDNAFKTQSDPKVLPIARRKRGT